MVRGRAGGAVLKWRRRAGRDYARRGGGKRCLWAGAWFTPGSLRRAGGRCVAGRCVAGGLAPAAALFDDGSLDVSSASLSGGLTVLGEAMHHGGLTLMPPPAGAASTLTAPAGVVSASSEGPAERKVSLFRVGPRSFSSVRVGPRSVFSADDDGGSGGECARRCAAISRSAKGRALKLLCCTTTYCAVCV